MSSYVFIGTSVAAISAAEAVRSVEPAASITLVGEDPHGYYSRPGLAYYLSGELDEKILFPFQSQELKSRGFQIIHARVKRILPAEQEVELDTSKRISFDRLLIATGARAVPLDVPGAHMDGVVKLDNLEDARRIIAQARRIRSAVVTGGGITALELAEGLAARRVKVHYVLRGERYWPNILDKTESLIVEKHLREKGLILHHQTSITEILGREGKVTGVNLSSEERIPCEMVAYAIGVAPHIDLAKEAGIACERGILVDEHLHTNLPYIFAAGDVAQVFDPTSGKHVLDCLWTSAREQGHAAGMNMAGQEKIFTKPIPFNVTRLAGLTTTIIGNLGSGSDSDLVSIARGDSETWREIPDAIIAQSEFDENHLRLMIGEKHILGAILMGDQKLSTAIQTLVRNRVNIFAIREQLLLPGAPLATILADFWVKYSRTAAANSSLQGSPLAQGHSR